jgi:large subunit ribosomal protein L14
MIIKGTNLYVLDNSSPVSVKCIYVYNKKGIGSYNNLLLLVIMKSVQNLKINKRSKNNMLKGSICKGIIVQLKYKHGRPDGSSIKFDYNSCIVLNKQMTMSGTRIIGPMAYEMHYNTLSQKFTTLAPLIL